MFVKYMQSLLDVPSTDHEDARRRKLLNIILVGVGTLCILIFLFTVVADVSNLVVGNPTSIYLSVGAFIVVTFVIFYLNRRFPGNAASLLFLLAFTAVLPFSDIPAEIADGQSIFVFTIPIIMSSVLLRPHASFWFAFICSSIIAVVALSIPMVPNFPAIAGYFMVALISWLSARSLENALSELVVINRDLDQRVADRTRELSISLTRERIEAGKNQAILEGIADGVVVFDPENQAMVANPAVEHLLRIAPELLIGRSLDWILHFNRVSVTDCEAIVKLLTNPSPTMGNVRVQWGERTLAVNAAPVRTAAGELIGKVAVFRDFTREAEVDRLKSDFVAMVSHELRTPLSSVLGYAEMLCEGVYGTISDSQSNALQRVMANTRRLLTIVNDLLDQAQIEAGKLVFHNHEFHPTELLENLTTVMENIIHQKGLALMVGVEDNLPEVLIGDIQRLNQVLVNLVNNAVKFTESGYIRVRLFCLNEKRWVIEVSDTGVGIPPEAQKIIFDPFRQVNMDVTRQYGGIGLGLSIVQRLVVMMEGEISLTSKVGKGSTFTVSLPMLVAQAPIDKKESVI